jgi:hypothetical protein
VRFLVTQPGPSFSVHDLYVGWVEALRNAGAQVAQWNFDERLTFYGNAKFGPQGDRSLTGDQITELAVNGLCAALWRLRPDVLMVVSGFWIPHELYDHARRHYGTRVVVVHTEEPYEHGRELALAAHADLSLINDPTHLDDFRRITRAEYMPHAYRETIHHPGPAVPDMVCDFGFVGTGYPSRIAFLEAMDLGGLDVFLGGNWQALDEASPLRKHVAHDVEECMDNQQTADLYRSARVGLNLYRREAEDPELSTGWAMGPREVEAAACRHFYLRDPRGEGDEVLPMLPTFTSPGEASDLLRWWLAHDRLREDAAEAAALAVADRTFTNHARQLMRLLGA